MKSIEKETFICLDCETTGLDTANDKIIELAAMKFSFTENYSCFDTLVNPECIIPQESQAIHNISQDMVLNKPTIDKVLPDFIKFVGSNIIVGHGISFDIQIISNIAMQNKIPCSLIENKLIDTLRLARLYGESPVNSLEILRKHFNIEGDGAHRALNDVKVNIEVFKHLSKRFKDSKDILNRLKKPILIKAMPLGKHKGRKFEDIPSEYLQWAAGKDFDQDLLYSIRLELKNRKKGASFQQSGNPFQNL
jgi:DNA polymerase III subunit epsilon